MHDKENYREIGNRLRERRKQLDFTLKEVSNKIGVSENYISEIEKGDKGKVPSDYIIREISAVYKIDEREVFEGFGKLPISVVEELNEHEVLLDTLYHIKKSKKLSDDDRNRLYDEIQLLYKKHISRKD